MKRTSYLMGIAAFVLFTASMLSPLGIDSDYVLNRDSAHLLQSRIPRGEAALLVLDRETSGKIIIIDVLEKEIVAELDKPYGRDIEIGLGESEFKIVIINEGRIQTLGLVLNLGDCFRLESEDTRNETIDRTGEERPEPRRERETLLSGRAQPGFFAELGVKGTRIFGESALLGGGQIGVSLNRTLYLGVAGYGRMDIYDRAWDWRHEAQEIGYGGGFIEFSLAPRKLIHFRFSGFAGAGESRGRVFYIFEPGVELLLNLSDSLRLACGVSHPFVDIDDTGLSHPFLTVGLQFGK